MKNEDNSTEALATTTTLPKYFTQADIDEIASATTPKELLVVAKRVLMKIPGPAIGIGDPLSTKSQTDNLEAFNATTNALVNAGYNVLNEIPLQAKILEFKANWFREHPKEESCKIIVTDFFKPLLEMKKIKILVLLPNYMDNYVSYYEENQAKTYEVGKLIYLPQDWGPPYDVTKIPELKRAEVRP